MPNDVRVLVVDDDPVMRETLAKALQQEGYEAIRASSAEIAMRHFDRQPAEVMIVNLRTQDGDGVETIAEVKRRWPRMQVLGVSPSPRGVGYRRAALAAGASCTVSSPFRSGQLMRALREMI